jgi:hypothetical protein
MVGFRLSRSLWLSRSLFLETFLSPFMELRLPWSLSQTFTISFSRWNSGYHGAFSHISLIRWNFGYHEAFSHFSFIQWNFGYYGAFSHFSFIRWNFGCYRAFSHFSFIWWNFGYHGAFSHFSFIRWNFVRHAFWGKTLFIFITKSIYIESASLKTLPLDLEPPVARKRVRSSLF